jgi:hypothetical protein
MKNRITKVLVVALAALGVFGIAACAKAGGSGQAGPSSGTTTTAPSTPGVASPSNGPALYAWGQQNGYLLNAIVNDMSAIGNDQDPSQMQADCSKLQSDVQAALAAPPMPDTQAAAHWAAGLSDYNASASDCVNGLSQDDPTVVTQAVTEASQGQSELTQVLQRIKDITSGG